MGVHDLPSVEYAYQPSGEATVTFKPVKNTRKGVEQAARHSAQAR